MGRAPSCDKNGLKKGPWTPEEDQKLIDYIQKHGHGSWRTLPKNAGLERCGKSCRLRWTNYLRPDIKRGRFSFEEEETIIQLHSILGNKWSAIAARLPGRTDNEIKNYWNTHIRKRLLRMGIDPVTHSPRLDLLDFSSILNSSLYNSSQANISRLLGIQTLINPDLLKLASSLISSHHENPEFFLQNLQENHQIFNPQIQIQNPSFQSNHQIQAPTEDMETQFMQTNVELFPSNPINFEPNLWQENVEPLNLTETLIPYTNYGYLSSEQSIIYPLSENSNLQSNNNPNFSFASVLSTPPSSPTPLNSSSTYLNSNTEDERDSYCSNLLQFEMPEILDVNDFM